LATSSEPLHPCPYCGSAVQAEQLHCSACGVRLLYGLIAAPESDPRKQDRAAAILVAVPGGPGQAEARRRVREGLPLIVGLTRRRTEEIQSRLVDVGLLARIGPAPRGTAPLEPEQASRRLLLRVAIAAAIPLAAYGLFASLEPAPPPPAAAPPASTAEAGTRATPAPRLDLRAGFERSRHGHLWLVCLAQVRDAGPPPSADLVLRLRDGTGTVIWTGSLAASGARDRPLAKGDLTLNQRTLTGRLSLDDVFLEGGERLTLEGSWHGRSSAPAEIEVPPRTGR